MFTKFNTNNFCHIQIVIKICKFFTFYFYIFYILTTSKQNFEPSSQIHKHFQAWKPKMKFPIFSQISNSTGTLQQK